MATTTLDEARARGSRRLAARLATSLGTTAANQLGYAGVMNLTATQGQSRSDSLRSVSGTLERATIWPDRVPQPARRTFRGAFNSAYLRIRQMTEHLHERKPMATNTLIGFAGVALTFAGVALTILALIGTCVVAYGAWSRSEGERAAYEHVTSEQLRTLQSAKDSTVVELAVLKQADATRDHTHEVLGNKIDEYRAYVQSLTIKMTQAGVRDIPSPPK